MTKAPIDPSEWLYGVNVVQIGDIRVSRGLTRRPFSSCNHKNMTYCTSERRVWCQDCETEVDPFDAFTGILDGLHKTNKRNREEWEKITEAKRFNLVSLAAKAIDKAWRSRTMAPACPSCKEALLPEDFKNGATHMVSKDLARRKRGIK